MNMALGSRMLALIQKIELGVLEVRRALGEEGFEPLGEVSPVGNPRQVLQLLVKMVVEPVDPRRLVQESLGDAVGPRRTLGQLPRQRTHLDVEALGWVDRRDEAHLERSLGVEARVE